MMGSHSNEHFIPALRYRILTRFYDPLVRYSTREGAFKEALLTQGDIRPGQAVLDLACGSGTLAVAIKRSCPEAEVFAIDADAEILRMAKAKARESHVGIDFTRAYSYHLPYEVNSFERVFSTLFFHHLTLPRKIETLREILRVLKPGGEFHLADFALPKNVVQSVLSRLVRLIDGYETTRDNFRGRLKYLMERNGFADVARTDHYKTIIGTIRLFRAVKK